MLCKCMLHADPNFTHFHRKLAALIPFDGSFPCVHSGGGLKEVKQVAVCETKKKH